MLSTASQPSARLPETERSPDYGWLYRCAPTERIRLIRKGMPAQVFVRMSNDMGVTKERLFKTLHFSSATMKRKLANNQALPQEWSERMLGLQKLIGQVEVMIEESGRPEGFNAARWVADWLEQPAVALAGARPAEFMDTVEGQEMIADLLAKLQSGAYA